MSFLRLAASALPSAAAFVTVAMLGSTPAIAQAAPAGATVYQQRCSLCHSVVPDKNGVAPSLAGVVGRKAGSLAKFSYSPALKASGIVWTPAQLDTYLANPQKAVPGSRMPLALGDPALRKAVIAYLATLK
ncbi:c-type cytochrome [Sphingomonas glacialis]|nr:c-type cytochrome [Sphingomonas glacialis]